MSLVEINWRPTTKELRTFGGIMLGGFGLLGALLYFAPWPVWWNAQPTAGIVVWSLGGVAGILGVTGTRAALPPYWAWMGIAYVSGSVMSRVILGILYYGMITPLGQCLRLFGRDPLQLRRRETDSYWIDVPPAAREARYERQF